MKILLVDDNDLLLSIQSKILEKTGASVDCVDSGMKAIELLERSRYDLVVMDCQMPDLDGFETTQKIRLTGNLTPIVALTGNDSAKDREDCKQAGMNGFLAKPLTIPALNLVLQDLNIA